ncbi:MAG: hypothetical protein G8345_21040, partial [Magnetococcales bacterium]|nr:hypothetical protein [Magnetococcales bacterium]
WTATYTPTANVEDTTNIITVDNTGVSDAAGNAGSGSTDSDNYTVDTKRPTVTVSLNDTSVKVGETPTVTFTFSEAVSGFTEADVTVANGSISTPSSTDGGITWTATYTPTSNVEDATNVITVDKTGVTDGAGNAGSGTTDSDNYTVDTKPPTVTDGKISLSGASGTGGAYKVGDTVTATWDNTAGGDNNNDISGVTVNFSQFGGGTTVVASNSSGTWTATYTITEEGGGAIDTTNRNVAVTATDNAGNTTTTSDTTNATVDNDSPILTDAKITLSGAMGTDGAFKVGDTVTATWNNTASGDNNGDTISGVTVNFSQFGGGTAVAASNSSGIWTATYTITENGGGSIDTTNRNVAATATDNAGNTTTTSDTTNATVDNVKSTLSSDAAIVVSSGSGTSGAYRVGDQVTVTIADSEILTPGNSDVAGITVDFTAVGGGSAVAMSRNGNGNGWTASYTIVDDATDIDATNRQLAVTLADNAGNATTVTDTTQLTVDNVKSTLSSDAAIVVSSGSGTSGAYRVGDQVTVTIADSEILTPGNSDVAGITVDFTAVGGGSAVAMSRNGGNNGWTTSYTIVDDATDIDATNRQLAVTLTDNAGNATTVTDTTQLTVDNVKSTLSSDAAIVVSAGSGTSGTYRVGDQVTVTIADTNILTPGNSDVAGITVDFTAVGGGSAVAMSRNGGNNGWTASYTIVDDATDIDATNRQLAVTLTDNAGNATTVTDTTQLTVDNVKSTLSSDAAIVVSSGSGTSGAYRVGDQVTVTIADSEIQTPGNSDVTGITVDFTAVGGGSAVAMSRNGNGNGWTASYTIVDDATDIDATNRQLAVTLTDNAGNATTVTDTTQLTVDNVKSTLSSDAAIVVSSGSGTSGAYRVGDQVTVTIADSEIQTPGNSDVAGITVDFTAVGGGSAVAMSRNGGNNGWTASYTLVDDATDIDATNRQLAVTLTDNAGNATTVTDTTQLTVDNVKSTLSSDAAIVVSSGSGTSGAYRVGDQVTVTIADSEILTPGNSDVAGITVDFTAVGGGSAVAMSRNGNGNGWTASYTIVDDATD